MLSIRSSFQNTTKKVHPKLLPWSLRSMDMEYGPILRSHIIMTFYLSGDENLRYFVEAKYQNEFLGAYFLAWAKYIMEYSDENNLQILRILLFCAFKAHRVGGWRRLGADERGSRVARYRLTEFALICLEKPNHPIFFCTISEL